MSMQHYRIPEGLIKRLRTAKDKQKPVLNEAEGPTFWVLHDLLLIIDNQTKSRLVRVIE